jgi:hypothetical protein
MADDNFSPLVRLLDFSNQGELASFKEQVNLIYKAFRQRKILMPHSVFMPKKELLRALGVVERDGELFDTNPERTGLLVYVSSSSEEATPNLDELIQELFPVGPLDPDTNASSFTMAIVATNDERGSYQATGANFVALSECPPRNDCPPWHTPPPVNQ